MVYTQDEKGNYNDKSLNELILEEGYAEIDKRENNPYHPNQEKFRNLENQARKEHKGIWNYQENMKWQDNH